MRSVHPPVRPGGPTLCERRPGTTPRSRPKAAAGALLVALASAAHATADGPDHFAVRGVSAGHVLNIRAEPDAKAPRVGAIPATGTCIRNLGCRGGLTLNEFSTLTPEEQERRQRENPRWCRIEYRGTTGWVAGRYLREGDCRR
jgi:uncharacterized protein YraI